MKICDIIIPVWNQLDFTKDCIESLLKDDTVDFDIIIIDNASDEPTKKYLKVISEYFSNIKLIRNDKNLGFIKAVNMALRMSQAPYVCLLNNDTVTTKGWLRRLIDLSESNKTFGLVTPLGSNEHIKNNMSIEEFEESIAGNKGKYVETAQAMGFCMLIKREVFDKIGFLDEIFGMGGFDDTDYSKRAYNAGYKCVTALDTYVYHRENVSFKVLGEKEERIKRNEKIFYDKWEKFYRILFITFKPFPDEAIKNFNTAMGLAREWHWIHFLVLSTDDIFTKLKEYIKNNNIPEHQNLRKFYYKINRFNFILDKIFMINLVLSLIARGLKKKGRKQFDLVITTNYRIASFFVKFKKLLKIPIYLEVSDLKEAKKLKNDFLNNLSGVITHDNGIYSLLRERNSSLNIIVLPYGLENPKISEDRINIIEFEKSWVDRSKKMVEWIEEKVAYR